MSDEKNAPKIMTTDERRERRSDEKKVDATGKKLIVPVEMLFWSFFFVVEREKFSRW